MEEVRTSIEKIFDSFEANHRNHVSGKQLDYSFLNNSRDGKFNYFNWFIVSSSSYAQFFDQSIRIVGDGFSPSRKRPRGIDDIDISSINHSRASSLNISTLSQSSHWETRILKADIIEANSKVSLAKCISGRIGSI